MNAQCFCCIVLLTRGELCVCAGERASLRTCVRACVRACVRKRSNIRTHDRRDVSTIDGDTVPATDFPRPPPAPLSVTGRRGGSRRRRRSKNQPLVISAVASVRLLRYAKSSGTAIFKFDVDKEARPSPGIFVRRSSNRTQRTHTLDRESTREVLYAHVQH